MTSPLTRSACGIAALAALAACGGVKEPDFFSASNGGGASGSSNRGGASTTGGESARAGAANGGAPSSGGTAGDGSTDAGSADGGSTTAGSTNAGTGGAAQAGTSGSAGSPSGGRSGAGGASGGGNGGSNANAGNAGSGDETCATLFAKASQQLTAAQVCSFASQAPQCTGTVKNLCNCGVFVNGKESAETKDYEATLAELSKKKCVQVCTAVACLPATHASCKASSLGSATGTCAASFATQL